MTHFRRQALRYIRNLCPAEFVIGKIDDVSHIRFIASFLLMGVAGKSDIGIHKLLGIHIGIAEDPVVRKGRITG